MSKTVTSKYTNGLMGLCASNHSSTPRQEHDYYATDPVAAEWLIKLEDLNKNALLEPSCGEGHLAKVFEKHGFNVTAYDLIDRGYGECRDFFSITEWDGDIVTNPPYNVQTEFFLHALNIVKPGNKVCMFVKLLTLEGNKRRAVYDQYPPVRIWLSTNRIMTAKNGDFTAYKASAIAFCWIVWIKGVKKTPTFHWFN